jgi:hypothetical protein
MQRLLLKLLRSLFFAHIQWAFFMSHTKMEIMEVVLLLIFVQWCRSLSVIVLDTV